MTTQGSFLTRSASSPAVIRTSVMAGLSCLWLRSGSNRNLFRDHPISRIRQHLAQLLGGGRDDGDEIGLAKPALGAMAFEVSARAAMEHRRMRGGDGGIAHAQPERH